MNLLELVRKTSNISDDVLEFIFKQKMYQVKHWGDKSSNPNLDGRFYTTDPTEANVVSSIMESPNEWEPIHRPVIDIDFPIAVVPSSTPGHFHLFIDKQMTWSQYTVLLGALVNAGIVEKGFLNVALKRGTTMVRLPWVRK